MEHDETWTPCTLVLEQEDIQEIGTPEALGKLYSALAKAQGAFDPVRKTKTVKIQPKKRQDGTWPKPYTFDYAPLSELKRATRAALAEQGLALLQPFTMGGRGGIVRTILSCGEARLVSAVHFQASRDGIKDLGGQTTYLRRYAMNCMLGLDGDDDVDNVDENPDVTPPPKKKRSAPPRRESDRDNQRVEENPFDPEPPGEPQTSHDSETGEVVEPEVILDPTDEDKVALKKAVAAAREAKQLKKGPAGANQLNDLCIERYGAKLTDISGNDMQDLTAHLMGAA